MHGDISVKRVSTSLASTPEKCPPWVVTEEATLDSPSSPAFSNSSWSTMPKVLFADMRPSQHPTSPTVTGGREMDDEPGVSRARPARIQIIGVLQLFVKDRFFSARNSTLLVVPGLGRPGRPWGREGAPLGEVSNWSQQTALLSRHGSSEPLARPQSEGALTLLGALGDGEEALGPVPSLSSSCCPPNPGGP